MLVFLASNYRYQSAGLTALQRSRSLVSQHSSIWTRTSSGRERIDPDEVDAYLMVLDNLNIERAMLVVYRVLTDAASVQLQVQGSP